MQPGHPGQPRRPGQPRQPRLWTRLRLRLERCAGLLVVALIVAGGAAACRGDAVDCEKGCRNYGTLVYRKNAAIKVAQEPEATRDALRKELDDGLAIELEKGLPMCISQCQSSNHKDDIACMIAAKTGEQAEACLK
jgi:hypothetical protein